MPRNWVVIETNQKLWN